MATVVDDETTVELPDRYEVVNGVIVEVPPMSGFSSEVANRIRDHLTVYAASRRNGRPRSDMLFRIPLPNDRTRSREPDVAYISFDRWPESRPLPYRGNPVDVVPELMVEVASPTDTAEELLAKAHEYLRAGANLVWVVFPLLRQVYAYTAQDAPPRVFGAADALDAGDVLPGFVAPMAGLFPQLIVEKGKHAEDGDE
jgi:Uma2 family endonuclease